LADIRLGMWKREGAFGGTKATGFEAFRSPVEL